MELAGGEPARPQRSAVRHEDNLGGDQALLPRAQKHSHEQHRQSEDQPDPGDQVPRRPGPFETVHGAAPGGTAVITDLANKFLQHVLESHDAVGVPGLVHGQGGVRPVALHAAHGRLQVVLHGRRPRIHQMMPAGLPLRKQTERRTRGTRCASAPAHLILLPPARTMAGCLSPPPQRSRYGRCSRHLRLPPHPHPGG
ncbi:hypothetical protein ACFFX0_26650 [Citricoccus parietis]|uniref:Uncharacterized protein n=1 Tax=Citricoccus parietis TaxID=592307 RepID=A0ABV5G6J4_9MICC